MQNYEADFSLLIRAFSRLIQVMADTDISPGQEWKNDGQVFLIKAFRHLESIDLLYKGVVTVIDDEAFPTYIDHSSISVLARAAFETYLLFYFIFCDGPEEQRELRHRIWKMIGLKERQVLRVSQARNDFKWTSLLVSEKKEIERLEGLIKADRHFHQFTNELKDKVFKKNDVKIGRRWMDLAELAGFSRKYAYDRYTNFCNYAHSGLISIVQIRDAINEGQDKMLAENTLSFCTLLMGQILLAYTQLFPEVEQALTADAESFAAAANFQGAMRYLDKIY